MTVMVNKELDIRDPYQMNRFWYMVDKFESLPQCRGNFSDYSKTLAQLRINEERENLLMQEFFSVLKIYLLRWSRNENSNVFTQLFSNHSKICCGNN